MSQTWLNAQRRGVVRLGTNTASILHVAAFRSAPPPPLPGPPGSGGAQPRPGGILPSSRGLGFG